MATLLGSALFLVLMAGLFGTWEVWQPQAGTTPRPGQRLTAVVLFFLGLLAMEGLGAPVLDAVAARVPAVPWPRWRLLLAAFVGAELLGYWLHRAMHHVPSLWRLHAVHHAPSHLDWAEAWRQHPLDFLLHGLAVGLPGALLGASLSDVAGLVLLRKTYTTFLHANIALRLGPLEWLVASPAFHRLHHSADPLDFDSNFAGTFPVLDVLFGTYRKPTVFPAALGLEAADLSLVGQLLARPSAAESARP